MARNKNRKGNKIAIRGHSSHGYKELNGQNTYIGQERKERDESRRKRKKEGRMEEGGEERGSEGQGRENNFFNFRISFSGVNSYVANVSMHNNFNRQLTIHGSNGVNMSGCVAHRSIGHQIMFEDGNEEGNNLYDNLVLTTMHYTGTRKRGKNVWNL